MNRKIIFRGKRLDNGEWVYGDLLQTNEGSVCIGIHGQYIDDGMHFNDFYDETPYIDEDTLGQFTGLLDAHGKEIYEGDILKGTTNKWRLEDRPEPHDFVGYVRWEEQCDVGLEWVLTSMDSIGSSPLNYYVHCVAIDYSTGSIIGNIHDNPELLNEK